MSCFPWQMPLFIPALKSGGLWSFSNSHFTEIESTSDHIQTGLSYQAFLVPCLFILSPCFNPLLKTGGHGYSSDDRNLEQHSMGGQENKMAGINGLFPLFASSLKGHMRSETPSCQMRRPEFIRLLRNHHSNCRILFKKEEGEQS